MAIRLSEAIDNLVNEFGLRENVDSSKTFKLWDEAVGKAIAKKTKVEKVERGKIYVKVDGDSWRQELTFMKNGIIEKINGITGENTVKEIILH